MVLLGLVATLATAQPLTPGERPFPRFTLSRGDLDADGLPTSGAKICALEGARVCYQMPSELAPASNKVVYAFGIDPRSERLTLPAGGSWVFFAATFSGGGSGMLERLAVLRYQDSAAAGKIVNLLPYVAVTDQSDRAMWQLPSVSDYPILVLADFIWNVGETHFSRHFYTVEAWRFDPKQDRYEKACSYRTGMKYRGFDEASSIHVLAPERASILRCLEKH